MTAAVIALWAVLIAAALGGAGFGIYARRREKRTMERLDKMLEAAMEGNFREEDFDESMLSAVEARFYQYLAGNGASARNLRSERDRLHALVSDISHQTRTPLANILLYTELLAERTPDGESRELVEALAAQTEKLRALMEALVKTSRLETGVFQLAPKRTPVGPMLEKAAAQYSPAAEAKGLTLTLASTEAEAVFDGKWTGEAVCNLLDNAVKYTPPGGSVAVWAEEYDMFCRVHVTDSGPGVPEAEQAQVFRRFYRGATAGEAEGVGVGLYLAREIAAGQGGYIKLTSKSGEGADFSLFLPR